MAFDIKVDSGAAYQLGGLTLFIAAASILTALGLQYYGGYQPCMLCLWERYAYYFAIPVLFCALALVSGGYKGAAAFLFFLVALAFLGNAALGTYHAGAEWKWWSGPMACGGGSGLATSAGSLLKELEHIHVPRCDEAALVVFGLSFAGWNVVASMLLMILSLRAAFAARESHPKG